MFANVYYFIGSVYVRNNTLVGGVLEIELVRLLVPTSECVNPVQKFFP